MSNFDPHGLNVAFQAAVLMRLPLSVTPTRAMQDALLDAIESARETEIMAVDASISIGQISHERQLRPGFLAERNAHILKVFIETTVPATFNKNDDDDWLFNLGEIDATAMRTVIGSRLPTVVDSEIEWSWSNRNDETETARKVRLP